MRKERLRVGTIHRVHADPDTRSGVYFRRTDADGFIQL
jgi:hypothetical protein